MPAARPQYSLGVKAGGTQTKSITVTILNGAALAAFVAGTFFRGVLAERAKIIGVRMNIESKGGTFATAALDVQAAGVSLLGSTFDVAAAVAGTPVDKEIANLAAGAANVAANSEITIVTTVSGGTSPTWATATVQIDYVPLG